VKNYKKKTCNSITSQKGPFSHVQPCLIKKTNRHRYVKVYISRNLIKRSIHMYYLLQAIIDTAFEICTKHYKHQKGSHYLGLAVTCCKCCVFLAGPVCRYEIEAPLLSCSINHSTFNHNNICSDNFSGGIGRCANKRAGWLEGCRWIAHLCVSSSSCSWCSDLPLQTAATQRQR